LRVRTATINSDGAARASRASGRLQKIIRPFGLGALLPPVRLGLFRKELIKDIVIAARRSSPGDVKLPLLRERRGVFGVLVVLAFLVAQVLLVLLIVVEGTSPDFRTLGLLSRIWDHRHRRHSRAVRA
jgi:hypothetical protein